MTDFRRIMTLIGKGIAVAAILGVAVPLIVRAVVALRFQHDTSSVEAAPPRPVAIVFGARVYSNGRLSAMLADRVATAVDLYRRGKVRVLLMTGDNSTVNYDEPGAMKRAALQMGVPEAAIVLDYAGRRTYDSCYRARNIFQVSQAILVSQEFHLDRALMLCDGLGIDATGVSADYQRPAGYAWASITYSRLREIPAIFVGLIDLVLKPTPILGEPLPISLDDPPQ